MAYYGIVGDSTPLSTSIAVVVITTLVLIAGLTRLSTVNAVSRDSKGRLQVPTLPYWIPYVGHALRVVKDPGGLLAWGRRSAPNGVFSLYILGKRHCIVFSPSLVEQELGRRSPSTLEGRRDVQPYNVIGPSKFCTEQRRARQSYDENGSLKATVPDSSSLANLFFRRLSESLPTLVSGCASPVDQMPWEKNADADATANGDATECDLYTLVQSFVAHALLQAFMPSSPPDLITSLARALIKLNELALPLDWGIPRWLGYLFPLPSLHATYRARNELVALFEHYIIALDKADAGFDPGAQWVDLDNISVASSIFGEGRSAMKSAKVSAHRMAGLYTSMMSSMYRNIGPLAFWSILTTVQSSESLTQLRTEARTFVTVEDQVPMFSGSSIKEPPKIKFHADKLISKDSNSLTGLLEQATFQHLRSICFRELSHDAILVDSRVGEMIVKAGDEVAISCELFSQCTQDKASDRIEPGPETKQTWTQRLWSKILESDPHLSLETTNPLTAAIVVGIVSLWDIKPATRIRDWNGRIAQDDSWEGFETLLGKRTAGVDMPAQVVRVRVKRHAAT